jgi:phosphopantothenoylcysteine decarboxylase/phosphopantothenate--cysteine ligase
MQDAVLSRSDAQDIIIQSAAIADFRPAQVAPQKIKKSQAVRAIELEQTVDFSVILGEQKRSGQMLVGFAAETEKMEEHALGKLRSKNLDLLIANDITRPGAGFEVDTNIVTFYRPDAKPVSLPQQSKRAVADAICDQIVALRQK